MRTSCITHPANDRLIILRSWQLDFCEGNHCAAALLSFFEHWHNYKVAAVAKNRKSNDIAENHGGARTQDESLYQFHTNEELSEGIMGLYGKSAITDALNLLIKKKTISVHKNPNPRYSFDKTNYYLFYPDVCNNWLTQTIDVSMPYETPNGESNDSPKSTNRESAKDNLDRLKVSDRESENSQRAPENSQAITQITTQINNKQIDGHEEVESIKDQKDSDSELIVIRQLLQTAGFSTQQLNRSDDLQLMCELIRQIRKKNLSPPDIFIAALHRANRVKQNQAFGLYYLAPIVRQLLDQNEKTAFYKSPPIPIPKKDSHWEEKQNYFSPDYQTWMNESEG